MRIAVGIALGALVLSACTSNEPRARGVGFDDYSNYELERAQREAALVSGQTSIIPPARVNVIPGTTSSAPGVSSSDLANAGIGQTQFEATVSPTQGVTPLPTTAAAVPPVAPTNNTGISDEQNFDAVSGRETIESDAARREAQAAAREQIAATAVPERPANTGPNIVEYAVNAPNVKGQEWYSRSLLSSENRYRRNCADYVTADDAQRDFLARGGPERDRRGIDPDGDGFACGWDPAPFK
ncbi:hypothetical protein DS901_03740 [Loktanella sp. D2R18]|uniref:hypothetical protein n=1 Tax=Rhodobacterales TaxID=204455 RepID=UPI000DE9D155|nr:MULTISPECIES: hypothetical protein [Rhodobacterales]MDO6589230.1 hypothetical protein [Yoonia sp. 1_MG-2023]RBW45343.1 hypothetical protein DS901_03740 [Loktanella sp. D2R18]